ncbi:squalene/phytoene synthase family protein, partial [Methylopila musalis]
MTTEGAPDPVATLVRDAAFDAYAAGLFAPAEARPHLYALQAFDIELSRVRDLTREPLPGEMRFQWWRDALADPSRADAAAHPVLRALEAAIRYGALPRPALQDLIDARNDDLYDDPLPTVADLEARLGATWSVLLRLSSLILAQGRDPGGADVAGHGGLALGLTRLARELARAPQRAARLIPVELMATEGVGQGALQAGEAPD